MCWCQACFLIHSHFLVKDIFDVLYFILLWYQFGSLLGNYFVSVLSSGLFSAPFAVRLGTAWLSLCIGTSPALSRDLASAVPSAAWSPAAQL